MHMHIYFIHIYSFPLVLDFPEPVAVFIIFNLSWKRSEKAKEKIKGWSYRLPFEHTFFFAFLGSGPAIIDLWGKKKAKRPGITGFA